MQASEANLLQFLDNRQQFMVPIFQRRHSWEKRHCEQLWKDVLRVGRDESAVAHFLGSIVYIDSGIYSASRVSQLLLIDGQQRLTTLSLLLFALGKAIEERSVEIDIDRGTIEEYYLFNLRERGELHYKLLLTKHDKETLIHLLKDRELPADKSRRLEENYRFFEAKLKDTDLQAVYEGLQKLMIVDISLDRDHDNPQLIFESLNSTGLDLSQADLIRNYVLMGQEPNFQNRMYETYWYPIEQRFGEEYTKRFDRFIRDYLTLKTRRIPNIRSVYEHFKNEVDNKEHPEALEATIAEIGRYSRYYVCIALLQEECPKLLTCFEDIHVLNVETVFPFLLEVYDDYVEAQLEKEEIIEILRLIECYIFRRAICGIETRGLNRIFATLMLKIDKSNYLESLKRALAQMTFSQRYPSDTEFKENFCIKDVYNFHPCRYLLHKLENHEHSKELISLEHCTIEHVMPQNPDLSENWQEELGENWREVQEKYLHTIGNLTLTGYNSELGDRPFKEKQEIPGGFCDSPLHLNRSLTEVERWNEIAIVDRAETLAEKACKIWPYHGVVQEIQEKQEGYWTLAHHHHLIGEMLELFQQLGQRVLKLDASVREQITKYYIGYSMNTTFVTIYPQAKRLRLLLNLPFSDINDPQGVCRDLAHMDHHQLGDIEVGLYSTDELDDIMFLIHQAFEKQKGAQQEQGKQKGVRQEQRGDWTLADHHHLISEMMELFQQLRKRILNLNVSVSEGITKRYIGYSMNTIFVAVMPQAKRLLLSLNLPFSDINDPRSWCRDVTNVSRDATGDVAVGISSVDDLDYIMFLVRQAFEKQITDR